MASPPSYQALLLVDGYNIIGAWPQLIAIRDREGLDVARRHLTEVLASYSAVKDFDTCLVFDAYSIDTPGVQERVTQHLRIHYTDFGQTADSYIEKVCAKFRNDLRKFSQQLIVATSDRAEQLTVVGYGAEWMSTARLADEVRVAQQRVRRRQRPAKQASRRLLAHSLDPQAQAKLAKLRLELSQPPPPPEP